VIILSKTGETKSLIDIVKNIKLNGVSVIYIGEVGHSTIGDLADYKLAVAKVEEEGIDMDSRLQEHFAINLLTKKITDKIQSTK
ncbi:SIS domain-containing protein, partial [Clostridium saudiense]|nr:SIS domain-containing protein [Clostridium saudiense]